MLLYTGGRLAPEETLDRARSRALRRAAPAGRPRIRRAVRGRHRGRHRRPRSAARSRGRRHRSASARPRPGVTPLPGGAAAVPGARTHYAFDSAGSGGTVRVIVIDNSRGSLAASDPLPEPARAADARGCGAALADARANGIPAIVVGSRDLNSRFQPSLNVATDADEVAQAAGRRGRLGVLLRAPGGEPRLPDPERRERDDPGLRHGHARLPLAAGEHQRRPGRRVRRRRPAAGRGRHRQARPGDQPRAGRRAAAAGRVRADAAGGRRHAAAALAPLAVPGPRTPAGGWRPLGRRGRRRRPAAARLGSLHRAPGRSRAPARRARRGSRPSTSSAPPIRTSATSWPRTRRRRTCASR